MQVVCGVISNQRLMKNVYTLTPQAKTNKRQARRDNMKDIKRILEKFDSWKYDIYENNRSTWTDQDDDDVLEIEKLLNEQASKRKREGII